MITINLYHEFLILMCSNALFSTALSSLQLLKGDFSGASWVTEKMQETGLTDFRSYPGQESRTICRCHSLGDSTLSSDILRLRVMVQSWAWTLDLWRSTTWTKLNRRWYWRGYWLYLMLFTHIPDIDTPDTIDTWGAVTCHKPHNPLLTKSENIMLTAYVWKTHLS